MKNFGNVFWAFFFFFCLIPYPILHYYSGNSDFSIHYLQNRDPKISLALLVLTISLWLLLFGYFFYRAIIMPFVMNNNLEKLKYSGVKREAKILNASKISTTSSNFPVYDLELSFENLSHRVINEKNFRIIDSKPYEKRFEAGKSLSIMLDESIKYPPYFSFESSTNKVNIKSIVLRSLFFILFIAVVIYFYFYAYTTENQGMGWRFLSIKHPLLLSPTILIATWIGLRLLMKVFNLHTGQKATLFKFKGIKTKAKILDTKITSYINRQPRVAFDLQFYDEKKHVHQCTLKKVVDLLKLNTASQEEIEIIYIPDNPKIVAFADDL